MIRTMLPKQDVFIVAGIDDKDSYATGTVRATAGSLINSTDLSTNLLDGQIAMVSAEYGQTTAYGDFVPTADATVAKNRKIQIVQGTPNSSNLRNFRGRYNRHQTLIRSAVIDGSKPIGFTAQLVANPRLSAWTINGVTVSDETEYMFHLSWTGEKSTKFYNAQNLESLSVSYKTPDYTALSLTNSTDHMYMKIAHEMNLNSKAYDGFGAARRPWRKFVTLCVDQNGSASQGQTIANILNGVNSIGALTITAGTSSGFTVGDTIRLTATNGGGTGATFLVTVATVSSGALATGTVAIENCGYGYATAPSTWTAAVVTGTGTLGTASFAIASVSISGAASTIVVEHFTDYSVSVAITDTITNTINDLYNSSSLITHSSRIVPINVSGSTLSSITTAGATAGRVDALVLLGLDWEEAVVVDESYHNQKARLHVGMEQTATVVGTVTEVVLPFRGQGSGKYMKLLSDRRYQISQYSRQSLPLYENFIEVPSYIDETLNYKCYIIESSVEYTAGYSHTDQFPRRTFILVPDTYAEATEALDETIGKWLSTATYTEYKDVPSTFAGTYAFFE